MLLTFTVFYNLLMMYLKKQTIRYNSDRWRKWWTRSQVGKTPNKLEIYWENPRNGGSQMGIGKVLQIKFLTIGEMDKKIAEDDGFGSYDEMVERLLKGNKDRIHMDVKILNKYSDVNDLIDRHKWAVISFDWIEGPVDVQKGEIFENFRFIEPEIKITLDNFL